MYVSFAPWIWGIEVPKLGKVISPLPFERLLGIAHGKRDAVDQKTTRRLPSTHAVFVKEDADHDKYIEAYNAEWERLGLKAPELPE